MEITINFLRFIRLTNSYHLTTLAIQIIQYLFLIKEIFFIHCCLLFLLRYYLENFGFYSNIFVDYFQDINEPTKCESEERWESIARYIQREHGQMLCLKHYFKVIAYSVEDRSKFYGLKEMLNFFEKQSRDIEMLLVFVKTVSSLLSRNKSALIFMHDWLKHFEKQEILIDDHINTIMRIIEERDRSNNTADLKDILSEFNLVLKSLELIFMYYYYFKLLYYFSYKSNILYLLIILIPIVIGT